MELTKSMISWIIEHTESMPNLFYLLLREIVMLRCNKIYKNQEMFPWLGCWLGC